jgi:hypothetical protein
MSDVRMKLLEAQQTFGDTRYDAVVTEASQLYSAGKLSTCLGKLEELPTEVQLLQSLMEKLKGKSVHTTLKRLAGGHGVGTVTEAVAITSLLTHALLEIKAGNWEYRKLAISILERATDKIYGLHKVSDAEA